MVSICVVISLFVTSVISETYYDYSVALTVLKEKKAAWESKGITDYVYQYSTGCFCPQCYVAAKYVVIEAGAITNVEFDEIALSKFMNPTSCSDADIQTPYDSNYNTISEFYDIAIAFAKDGATNCNTPTTTSSDPNTVSFGNAKCGGNIVFEYDATLFYPTIIGFHLSPNIADGDTTYNIGCLTAKGLTTTSQCDNYPQSTTTPTTTQSSGTATTLSPDQECSKKGFSCFDELNGECSNYAPCPNRDYCANDEASEWYLTCDPYPYATCTMTGCGGCTEYFTDYTGDIVDCTTNICELPADIGPCEALMARYFFNTKTGQCESFNYGGCKGNANKFESLKVCQAECEIVETSSTVTPTQTSKESTTTTDICELPAETGVCKAALPRYYFNSEKGKCLSFTYGGCGGNNNNFESLKDCQSECNVDETTSTETPTETTKDDTTTTTTTDICELSAEVGPCKASFTRYFFNSQTGECDTFTYGGCQGNDNNFETLQDCQTECGDIDICGLPAEAGQCEAAFPRYYFNAEKGKCLSFTYGGCGGNDNNFENLADCMAKCDVYGSGSSANTNKLNILVVIGFIMSIFVWM